MVAFQQVGNQLAVLIPNLIEGMRHCKKNANIMVWEHLWIVGVRCPLAKLLHFRFGRVQRKVTCHTKEVFGAEKMQK